MHGNTCALQIDVHIGMYCMSFVFHSGGVDLREVGDGVSGEVDREMADVINQIFQVVVRPLLGILRILYFVEWKKKKIVAHVLEGVKIYPFPGPR